MPTVVQKPVASPAPRPAASPGFTLMELLVSFTLIGLVAVFIHIGYSVGLSAREKAEASLEDYHSAQASLDVLSRQIASMVPYVSSQEHEERQVQVMLFQASRQSVGFVTSWSATSGFAGGLRFVQYFVADADSGAGAGRRLLLNEQPLLPDEKLLGSVIRGVTKTEDNRYLADLALARAGPRSLTLADGLDSVAFRTLERPEGEGSPLGSSFTPRIFRGRSRRGYRSQLPCGIQLSLRWNNRGPWGSRTFDLAVPVGGH